MTDAKRKIASLHIWGNGRESEAYADLVAKVFGIDAKSNGSYYYFYYPRCGLDKYKERYADKKSVLWLLFPKNGVLYYEEMCYTIGEMKRVYSEALKRARRETCPDYRAI